MPAIYPVFERPLPEANKFNGNFLSRWLRNLDERASSIDVTQLSRFIDSNTMASEVLDDEQLANIPVPPVQWHRAEDGLVVLRGILSVIEPNDARFHSRRGDEREALVRELRQLEDLLVSAAHDSNRFHLLVDI